MRICTIYYNYCLQKKFANRPDDRTSCGDWIDPPTGQYTSSSDSCDVSSKGFSVRFDIIEFENLKSCPRFSDGPTSIDDSEIDDSQIDDGC
jgi:hypothetical protein